MFPLLLYLIIFSGVQPKQRWANPPWARGYCIRQISGLCFKVLVGLQDPVEEHQMATCIKQAISVPVAIVLHNCEFEIRKACKYSYLDDN